MKLLRFGSGYETSPDEVLPGKVNLVVETESAAFEPLLLLGFWNFLLFRDDLHDLRRRAGAAQ